MTTSFKKYVRSTSSDLDFPRPWSLLYTSKVLPPPERLYHTPQPRHLLLLFISVTAEFAEFDTYPRTLIKCLYENQREWILRVYALNDSSIYSRCFAGTYRLKISPAYVLSLKSHPPFTFFGYSSPFRAYVVFE